MANPKPKRHEPSEFKKGNQAAIKHGGRGAQARIRKGEPFIGLALEVLEGVLAETGVGLEDLSGVEAILVKRAARFEATARMFDAAAESAASEGDIDRWERYQQRSGWIGSKAYHALADLSDRLHLAGGVVTDYEEVLADEGK